MGFPQEQCWQNSVGKHVGFAIDYGRDSDISEHMSYLKHTDSSAATIDTLANASARADGTTFWGRKGSTAVDFELLRAELALLVNPRQTSLIGESRELALAA